MSKRNIAYVKPQDPAFLARLKNQIGYKESATVETKRQKLEDDWNSDEDSNGDRDGEKPTIVVLKEGDLTAEEAAREEERIAREAAEAPADLNQRIIFKKRNKDSTATTKADTKLNTATSSTSTSSISSSSSSSAKKNSSNDSDNNKKTSKTTTKTTDKATKKQKNQKGNNNKGNLSFANEDEEEEEVA